ncbi:MAG TPA: NADH-quinone oxidoreductase subunit L, partial [Pirellulales bacterium]|nr:NADH-quinone oxidoreductase subunit L [Pirellulales bacterium]
GVPLLGGLGIVNVLEQARPAGETGSGVLLAALTYPNEHASHATAIHVQATLYAFSTALGGFLLATVFYGLRWLNPNDIRQQFAAIYRFLLNKWYFDELYDALFVRPAHRVAKFISGIDRNLIDGLIDRLARWTRGLSDVDDVIDRYLVDGAVNLTAGWIYSLGRSLRAVQTGKLRQYVMLIVIGTVALTILINFAAAK